MLAAAVWIGPRLLSARVRPAWFMLACFAITLVLRLALGTVRGGWGTWSHVFDLRYSGEAKLEYLPALAVFQDGWRLAIDRFAELIPSLPVHAAGHPPGLLLTMYALGIDTPERLAALCLAAGALAAPLSYLLARQVVAEPTARVAALLMTFAPGALLLGATSADAVYLALGLLAAWPLATRTRRGRLVGALALGVGSLFAWSLLAVGAWAALLALQREGWRRALELSALCGLGLVVVHGSLAAVAGWDPLGALESVRQVYDAGIASRRPYAYWVLGSPVAFLVVLGLPISFFALRGLADARPEAVAIFAVIAVAAVAGFTKAETERIWLFFAPFVCLAAAVPCGGRRIGWVLVALAIQAAAWETFFFTVW